MSVQHGYTVGEAAQQLGVTTRRVHHLIQSGVLNAVKIGRQFFIEPASLHRRLTIEPPRHRPLDPRYTWVLLALLAQDEALPVRSSQITPWALSRIRGRIRRQRLIDLAPDLRGRAEVHHLRADSEDLVLIAQEQSLVRTGVTAAPDHNLDLVAPASLEAYLPREQLSDLVRQYVLEPTTPTNIILHVPKPEWPFAPGATRAPALLAALDLYDSVDPRSRRAGQTYLERLPST